MTQAVLSKQTNRARRAFLRDERSARSVVRVVRKAFKAEGRAVVRAATGTSWDVARERAIHEVRQDRWIRVLETIYTEAAATDIWQETQAALGAPTDDNIRQTVLAYVGPALSTKAAGIRQTTIKALRQLDPPPAKASEGGLFRKAAGALYNRFGKGRAARIAVTETLQAASTVQHLAAKASATVTRGQVFKIWESVGDAIVRETHQIAHGQEQPLDVPFSVGFSQLDYPRDPYGPPAEVANCRCWTTHVTRGGASTEQGAVVLAPGAAAAEAAEESRWAGIVERFKTRRTTFTELDKDFDNNAGRWWDGVAERAETKWDPTEWVDNRRQAPAEIWKNELMTRHGERLTRQAESFASPFGIDDIGYANSRVAKITHEVDNLWSADAAENLVSQINGTWASTSGDEHPLSLYLQRRLAANFDSPWPPPGYQLPAHLLEEVDDLMRDGRLGNVFDAFIRNVYDDTQVLLREARTAAGLGDDIQLYRGGNFGDLGDKIEDVLENFRDTDRARQLGLERHSMNFENGIAQYFDQFDMNPGSSFSTNGNTAAQFAQGESEFGQVLFGDIPIERIWSTPLTGPGCLAEKEFILLANDHQLGNSLSFMWYEDTSSAIFFVGS